MSSRTEFDPYSLPADGIQEPPASVWSALRKIGPGIILAGTIVGSGELLATTKLGAEHGFLFLWLILFSCVIKVFVQVELGRYAISSGKPTLRALDELPGLRMNAHWLSWWWLTMMLLTIFQLGGMTGAVGQALDLTFPRVSMMIAAGFDGTAPWLTNTIREKPELPWAVLTCVTAVVLLWSGGYRRIEIVTTVLVVGVTILTVSAAMALPFTAYPIHWPDVRQGLEFRIPASGVATAFAVFGITGVGAAELFYYPYWCLEKGYARYVGRCDGSDAWVRRARGWIRVMYLDAWVSMVVFTVSTVAFYFMGAAVLHPQKLIPEKGQMIAKLSHMFVDSVGPWTELVFLIGAAAVLFKTLYLASAGNSRLLADFLGLSGAVTYTAADQRDRVIRQFSVLIPFMAFLLYLCFGEPATMVVVGGFAQALTLPMISAATIYLRYRKLDRRIMPSRALDICLWVAFVSITAVTLYAVKDRIEKLLWI